MDMTGFQMNPVLPIQRVEAARPDAQASCLVQLLHGETPVRATCLVPHHAPLPEEGQVFVVKITSGDGGISAELWENFRTNGVRYGLNVLPHRQPSRPLATRSRAR